MYMLCPLQFEVSVSTGLLKLKSCVAEQCCSLCSILLPVQHAQQHWHVDMKWCCSSYMQLQPPQHATSHCRMLWDR
jgi:hypothetical protein